MLRLLRSSAGIAIAMAVMNVGTYAFQMVAARLLGPSQYGAVAGLMALLMVLSVVQLGLQATAARRIAAAPEDVAAIEQTVLTTTWRAALVLGALAVAASPAVWWLLRLDGLLPAVLLGLCYIAFPYCVLTLYPQLTRLDPELTEAAQTMGASPWRTFWTVVVPIARPILVAGFLLVFVFTLGSYLIAPEWTPRAIERAKAWVARHAHAFAVRGLTALGALLVIKGLIGLLG